MTLEQLPIPALQRDPSFRRFMEKPMKPSEEEVDLQSLFENHRFDEPLRPEAFEDGRGWCFKCRACGGETHLRTRHPYCRHCGFSKRTL
jgi:hypothetical protein